MEDTAIELLRKRLDVLNTRLEILKQASAPLKAPPKAPPPPPVSPTGLLRLPFEIRLQIYHPHLKVLKLQFERKHQNTRQCKFNYLLPNRC